MCWMLWQGRGSSPRFSERDGAPVRNKGLANSSKLDTELTCFLRSPAAWRRRVLKSESDSNRFKKCGGCRRIPCSVSPHLPVLSVFLRSSPFPDTPATFRPQIISLFSLWNHLTITQAVINAWWLISHVNPPSRDHLSDHHWFPPASESRDQFCGSPSPCVESFIGESKSKLGRVSRGLSPALFTKGEVLLLTSGGRTTQCVKICCINTPRFPCTATHTNVSSLQMSSHWMQKHQHCFAGRDSGISWAVQETSYQLKRAQVVLSKQQQLIETCLHLPN